MMEEASEQGIQDTGTKKIPSKTHMEINFIEMPDGVIRFCAPYKPCSPYKTETHETRSRYAPRKNVDVDGISNMMQKLEFKTKSGSHKSKNSTRLQARKGTPKVTPRQKALFKDSLPIDFVPHRGFLRTVFTPTSIPPTGLVVGSPNVGLPGRYQSICLMNAYRSKSFEEIRFEDYSSGRKGPICTDHYGPKFHPGNSEDQRFSQLTRTSIPHQCKLQTINASREYADSSFEELRMEHYMPSSAWKDRIAFSLSTRELKKLPVSVGSKAFIYMDGVSSKRRGVIRYIGRLPGKPSKDTFAGIEFDQACGVSDGCYEKVRFFRTKDMCAEFVPIDCVLPEYLLDEKTSKTSETTKSHSDEDYDKGTHCSVCWENLIEIIFLPCGHICTCLKCSKMVKDCPVCRKKITNKHRAYISGK